VEAQIRGQDGRRDLHLEGVVVEVIDDPDDFEMLAVAVKP